MSLLDLFSRFVPTQSADPSARTDTVRRIVGELEALPPERARYLAAFAYVLSRVAAADLQISEVETRAMERLVVAEGGLPEEQAILVVQIAKSQNSLFGHTEDFLVTRELVEITTREQRRQLLHCLFAVAAADDSISTVEDARLVQIADELLISREELVEIRGEYSAQRDVLRRFRENSEDGSG